MSRVTARMYFNDLDLLPAYIDIALSVVNPLSDVSNLLCKLFKLQLSFENIHMQIAVDHIHN